jgi:Domain of unknown function (DUF4194)
MFNDDMLDRDNQLDLPAARPEGLPAVRLLQGVVYSDDSKAWELLLRHRSDLIDLFATLGLVLIVNESDGFAYLRQLSDDERTDGYQEIPRLFRRISIPFDVTVLCVLLRDELRRFEDEDLDNERCVVHCDSLLEVWKSFQPVELDDVQAKRTLDAAMRKLEQMRFVRPFGDDNEFEVRRILKARLPLETLEHLRSQLLEHLR